MYPYEVATLVDVLAHGARERRAATECEPGPAQLPGRSYRLRLMAGDQLIRLGQALAGRQPGPTAPLNASAPRQ